MKPLSLATPAVAFLMATPLCGQFAPGNLAVLRVGSGSGVLSASAAPVYIDQYSMAGTLQAPSYSLAIPAAGGNAFTISGTAATEGMLSRSSDGLYLSFAGYYATPGSSVILVSAGAVNRGAALVDGTGEVSFPVRLNQAFSGGSVRSAVTSDGVQFWLTGAGTGTSGGVWYADGDSALDVYDGINNLRSGNIIDGDLYISTGVSTVRGIHAFDGLPTTAGSVAQQVILALSGAAATDFSLSPNGGVMYISEDFLSSARGVQRWQLNGDTWELAYTLGTGAANVGTASLVVDWEGSVPVIYATTSETSANRLIRIEDNGPASAPITLATAPANTLFRGVDFSPIPEPGTGGLLVLGAAGLWLGARRRVRAGGREAGER